MGSIPIGGTRISNQLDMPVIKKGREHALALRLEGKTYGEIRRVLNIAKSTQSDWFKSLVLPQRAQNILAGKQGNGLIALGLSNKRRTDAIKEENEAIRIACEQKVGLINKRELMLIEASLYWAEGYKNFNTARKNYPYIGFSNSDPQMMRVFIAFLKDVLGIGSEKLRLEVHIYPQQSLSDARMYWHQVTGISADWIKAYVVVSPTSRGKRPKNLLPYGTAYLRINSRQEFFKVRGLIDGIVKGLVG